MPVQLSVIIVNYHSTELIAGCIQSLKKFNGDAGYEIIVVSNSSAQGEKETITNNYPAVRWIDMGYNAGFSRANNAGIKAAQADIVVLLNPDTLAIDDSLMRCTEKLKQSSYAACGVQLLNEDRTPQISGNFFMKGGLNHLLPVPYWGSFLRWIAFRFKTKVPNVLVAKQVEEVDWISGAFLMVKKDMINKAGLMDEDFFLYAEEVEWCSRLKKHGKLCIFGDLYFIHLLGEAISKDQNLSEKGYTDLYSRKGLQFMLSNHVRVRKQFGIGWFLVLLINHSWGSLIYFIADFLHRLFTLRNPFGGWPRWFAFTKNVFYIWKLSPVIIRNKPHFYKVL